MRVVLAPMEGVLDALVRELLCEINNYDLCITEFLRVVDGLLAEKSFYRLCHELRQHSRTPDCTPVRVQLVGQSQPWLAENAWRAAALESWGIDLNCSCLSKTVNDSGGGAMLLKDHELIYQAAKAIRSAVPADLPVSVKVRLGWNSSSRSLEIADAVEQAGASETVVHGRTKADGYRAKSVDWPVIAMIRQRLRIPVIANGEIMDWRSGQSCLAVSGCQSLMIGRGALSLPQPLSLVVKDQAPSLSWPQVVGLLQKYSRMEKQGDTGLYHVARIKQWLNYLHKHYPEAGELFSTLCALKTSSAICNVLSRLSDQAQ